MNIKIVKAKENISSSSSAKDTLIFFMPKSFYNQILSLNEEDILNSSQLILIGDYEEDSDIVEQYVNRLLSYLADNEIRWAHVVGYKEASLIAQALAICSPKLVRRMVLIDPYVRSDFNTHSKVIDIVERYIPSGLPLRKLSKAFDLRSEVHKIHAVTLLLSTKESSTTEKEAYDFLIERMPNVWKGELGEVDLNDPILLINSMIMEADIFKQVPVKSPQKNL